MLTTHFILVGFGDVGTKLFPTLLQIHAEERAKRTSRRDTFLISVVDIQPWATLKSHARKVLKDRFPHYSATSFKPKPHLRFLEANYFQDTQPDGLLIPPGLFKRMGARRTIVYLATDPDHYLALLQKYWPIGDVFAIEKPLARESLYGARQLCKRASYKAKHLADFAETYAGIFDKVFVGVDHYLGKYILTVFEYIGGVPEFAEVINDANTIIFQFLENSNESVASLPGSRVAVPFIV